MQGLFPRDFYDTHRPLGPTGFQVSLLICVRALQIHKEFLIVLLCASLWNFSSAFLCASLCCKSLLEVSNCVGVWYALQTYINVRGSSGLCHYLVYANNGRDRRLAKIFLGANDVRQHSTSDPRFIFLLREGRGVGFLLFPICSHENFTLFSTNLQVFNMFLKFPMCSSTCSQ